MRRYDSGSVSSNFLVSRVNRLNMFRYMSRQRMLKPLLLKNPKGVVPITRYRVLHSYMCV